MSVMFRGLQNAASKANKAGAAKIAADQAEEEKLNQPTYSMAAQPAATSPEMTPIKADNTAMVRRYETLRNRAKADVAQQTGEQQDALQRRFAQLGNLSSGAALKQQQLTAEQGAQMQQKSTEGLDMAQSQEQAQLEADAANKNFAREERVASQQFASGERASAQQFAAGESAASRTQQGRQFKASMAFEQSKFGQQFGEAVRMNNLEEKIQKFNMDMAEAEMNRESMFDRIGGYGTNLFKGASGAKGLKNQAVTGATWLAAGPVYAAGASNLKI